MTRRGMRWFLFAVLILLAVPLLSPALFVFALALVVKPRPRLATSPHDQGRLSHFVLARLLLSLRRLSAAKPREQERRTDAPAGAAGADQLAHHGLIPRHVETSTAPGDHRAPAAGASPLPSYLLLKLPTRES